MRTWPRSTKVIALAMAFVMLATSMPINLARAAMVTTDQVIEQQAFAGDRGRVMEFLAREDVRRQFEALGIDPDEATQRAAGLSNEEIQQIAGHLDELPAGQNALGILALIIVILFLVLLITDLLGVTDVFPFVKK